MKTTYVAASTHNGVYAIDPIDYPEMELCSIKIFTSLLKGMENGEIIFTVFGPENEKEFLDLNKHYGVY